MSAKVFEMRFCTADENFTSHFMALHLTELYFISFLRFSDYECTDFF